MGNFHGVPHGLEAYKGYATITPESLSNGLKYVRSL